MCSALLMAVIYIAFISLGLPDSMLGAAWPVMHQDLGVSVSVLGFLSMTVSCSTVISSLVYPKLASRLSTGTITAVSVLLTAIAISGYALAPSFYALFPSAIILGLGAGAVDAGLNNYAALHFKPSATSFLHAFWGIGTMAGPFLLSSLLSRSGSWRDCYKAIGLLQFLIASLLFASLHLWTIAERGYPEEERQEKQAQPAVREALRQPGVKASLLCFYSYTGLENTSLLWVATYMVAARGVTEASAAVSTGLFSLGITAGRLFSGFASNRAGDDRMIKGSQLCMAMSLLLFILLGKHTTLPVLLLGASCGPVYPSMIHQTPSAFGARYSQTVVSLEMATAYIAILTLPPLYGLLGRVLSFNIFPIFLVALLAVDILATLSKKKASHLR